MQNFFYRPSGAWAADFIPFYKDGRFHLFYLQDWRDAEQHGEGTPWYQISTTDFVHFTEHGEMLARGGREEQDLYVFTGSVIEAEGQYHIYYTGHNPHFYLKQPAEAIMHAVSDDLFHWRKIPEDTFFAPKEGYEPHDWRDPFIFWDAEAGEYGMLLAGRHTDGPSRRRGCTAYCVSKDLKTWEIRPPFYSPRLYHNHECPDLFQIGDWWYLVFSEYSEASVTRYRMSRSLRGPWLTPKDDAFDTRIFYAAKTASDGQRRYIFGWSATRNENKDSGDGQWGGNLVVHEIVQEGDGSLSVRIPQSVDRAFQTKMPFAFQPRLGACLCAENSAEITAPQTFGIATAGPLPRRCKIQATVTFTDPTRHCGLALRVNEDLETGYYIRLEPNRSRIVCDMWPRAADKPFIVETERPLSLTPGKAVELTVILDGTLCEIYADNKIALSTRFYNFSRGDWGVFATEGAASFHNVALYTSD